MLCDPAIGINGIEVTLATIGEDGDAGRASLNFVFYLIDTHHDGARRTASQNRFFTNETAASNHAIQIRDVYAALGETRLIELRRDGCAMPRYKAFATRSAGDHASERIDCPYPRFQVVFVNVVSAAAECAARTDCAEQVIDISA